MALAVVAARRVCASVALVFYLSQLGRACELSVV
jgi:hypothetical protein